MAEVIDVSACPRAPLASADMRAMRTLVEPGGQIVPPTSMMWPIALDDAWPPHREPATTADIELVTLSNAVVGGPGGHVTLDGRYVWSAGVYPGYVRVWLENDITPEHWRVPTTPTRHLPMAFAITHFNHVWGHWLTEVYPKLFQIKRLAFLGQRAPLLIPSTVPPFVRNIIRSTLPDQHVILYDPAGDSFLIEQLLLPDMMNRHYVFHPALATALDNEARCAARWYRPTPESIFVSRRRLTKSGYRKLDNALELECEARRLGLTVIAPERHSWSSQIRMFANAKVIVGEFGSGLHNAIFSKAGTKILALNWIVDVQSRIANFRHHRIGFILPDDGAARRYHIGQALQNYTIGLVEFKERLQQILRS